MAVAFDNSSESHAGTTGSASEASFSWSHISIGAPRGLLVFTCANDSADIATAVDINGVSLTAVTGGRAVDTATEPGDVKAWFLGSSVPSGTQTITVQRTNNATVMYAIAFSVTAGADTEVYLPGIVLLQENQTLAEQNVGDGSPGTDSTRFAVVNSGNASVPSAGANSTASRGIDFGARVVQAVRETTAGQGSRPVGFSLGTSDDVAAVHLAVREAAGGVNGSAAVALVLDISATGTVPRSGTATVVLPLDVAATGTVPRNGTASVPLALGVAATGTVPRTGTATVALPLAATATGTVGVSAISGTAVVPLGLVVSAAGTVPRSGTASVALVVGVAATGTVPRSGAAAVALLLAVTATGTVPRTGTASVPLVLGVAATGTVPRTGTATVALGLTATATGTVPRTGTATVPLPLGAVAAGVVGSAPLTGTATVLLLVDITATGTIAVQGAVTVLLPLTVAATGTVPRTGTAAAPLVLSVDAAGLITNGVPALMRLVAGFAVTPYAAAAVALRPPLGAGARLLARFERNPRRRPGGLTMTCSTQARAWYIDNTMVVQLGTLRSLGDLLDAPLTDDLTDTVITDATVTAQLETTAGVAVSGATWPLALSHVSGGVYRGAAPYGVVLIEGRDYVVEIQADKAGNRATWRVPVTAQQRTS